MVVFVAKCTDGRLIHTHFVIVNDLLNVVNESPILPIIENASSRTSMQMCAKK